MHITLIVENVSFHAFYKRCGLQRDLNSFSSYLTLWRPPRFRDFRKKTPKRTWLCAGISPVRYALQTR